MKLAACIGIAAISLLVAGCGGSQRAQQANQTWANAVCTSMLAWQKEIARAQRRPTPPLSPQVRLADAIAATRRLAGALTRIGLPETIRTPDAEQHFHQLGSAVQAQIGELVTAANTLENGNPASAGVIVTDLGSDAGLVGALLDNLQNASFSDLGIAALETRACRQLAGISA
ncbi:MAG TPA: hypothetical protein VMU39_26695 [Solirubrobacteraceae bacterium]|nr:hypothetical protein [Solirubrobacteraceae bacterium]